MRKILILLLFAFFAFSGSVSARPTAKITIKAIDEQGFVIEGAKVTIGFVIPNNTGIGTSEISRKGHTDNNGEFSASSGSMHLLGFSVDKEGYYQSGSGYEFKSRTLLLNRWEPWNPTVEIVLKKKRNPIPMYAKNTDWINVPKLGEPVGYDLEKGDWVTPYGRGTINDLIINYTVTIRSHGDYDCRLKLSFPNQHDGIQKLYFNEQAQSTYKWPYSAPENGYESELVKHRYTDSDKVVSNEEEDINYLIRVRTKTDKKGEIVSARYGKFTGDFRISQSGKIKFTYYFNPDGTMNMEFDPERNLFKWGRKDWEHDVNKP